MRFLIEPDVPYMLSRPVGYGSSGDSAPQNVSQRRCYVFISTSRLVLRTSGPTLATGVREIIVDSLKSTAGSCRRFKLLSLSPYCISVVNYLPLIRVLFGILLGRSSTEGADPQGDLNSWRSKNVVTLTYKTIVGNYISMINATVCKVDISWRFHETVFLLIYIHL